MNSSQESSNDDTEEDNDGGQDDDDDQFNPMFMNIFIDIVGVFHTISVISDHSTGILTADCGSRFTHTCGIIVNQSCMTHLWSLTNTRT